MFSKIMPANVPSYYKHILCIIVILSILAVCCYCVRCMSKKKTESFNGGDGTKVFMFFRADWCGHCKRFKPVWDEFKKECEVKHPEVKLMELDVDQETSKPLMEKHNVRGFPHIVITDENKEDVVFNKNRTKEDLLMFVQEQL
ncbi:thioredoxin domain-containing protein R362 [Pyramimonas orientalis virus]|uniref:Thioredoxin domain-containing protein R362 n=1 Tax=Pyramimonas orientalis virus 01B TaxID=3134525 RepID=A0A7M3UNL3_9VIRU|nr:thioredoxin domain-containing protein R362 [Pyramimonas orientalis virus]QOI90278.1 thioredoxin domain-containing protein R362 [Pyramimonas orientalis virus]